MLLEDSTGSAEDRLLAAYRVRPIAAVMMQMRHEPLPPL
jgi:hypothetical protein